MRTSKVLSVFRFIWLVALLAAAPIFGQTNGYEGPRWALADSKQALAAANEITLAKYPDCDEATVERKMVRVYRADGTGEAQDETFTKVLTEKGKRNNRTLGESFLLPYFTNIVVALEVIRPDGTVLPVDIAANSKETIDESQMSMNIYDPNSRVLQVNIPRVEIGDVVHSVVRQTTMRSIIPGEFAEYNVFEGGGFLRHASYEVYSPADRPLKRIALRDEIKGTITYTKQEAAGGGTIHRWEVNNVPRMFDEPSMPPYENTLQRLMVSTTPDWQTVSKWYWELSKPHLDATEPEMKKTADDLIANAGTDMQKIKAIFYHVSKKIRYMGRTPEQDRPGFEPHDVKLTFGRKYGVCRDKAALLVSLLRTAGLNAYPVLINVGTKKDEEVAEPFFNHAIVSVELNKGEYVLMDPTDENTRDLLPSSECNQSYLVCRPEGEVIKVSPVKSPEENMMRVKTTATLSASGSLQGKSDLSFDGINDNAYRNAFARMKPDDQRRFFERNLKHVMPGARLTSLQLTPTNMLDMAENIHATLEFSADGMTASGSGKSVVSLPWVGKGLGLVNFILGGTGLEKRKYPMQTHIACGLEEHMSISLGGGFAGAISMPSCSPTNDECLSYSQSFNCDKNALECSRELKLKVVEFSPAQYMKLKKTLELLEYDARKAPVMALAKDALVKVADSTFADVDPPIESNARILESQKDLEIKDPRTSVYRVKYSKKILTYSGKVREAEVKIDFNPSCQEAKIIRAVTISKAGERQEISKDEMSVMDAGWNASAKRYTGGKILVANLPGVDIGSTIEVEFEITSKNRPFLAGSESFQFPDDLDQKTFHLTAPANLKIQKLVTGPAGIIAQESPNASGGAERLGVRQSSGALAATAQNDPKALTMDRERSPKASPDSDTPGGKQQFTWTATHVKPLPAEPQLPPGWLYAAEVGYYVGDLKNYLDELQQTLTDRSLKRDKAAQTARELTNGKSRVESIRAIRDFVAKNIRLAGPSFTELPLSELSAADTSLADGYGHAADHAILLHAMLSAAGLKPQFVLASTLPPISEITKITSSFPLPYSFSIPLVRVTADGETYYLNDTDQYARLGSTSFDGRLALIPSSGSIETIKAARNCADKVETTYTLSLSDNGKTRLGMTRHFYGTHYDGKNRYFSELPPEERRRYFQEIVSGIAQGARPIGDLVTKFDTYPGLEQYTVEMDNYAVADGKYLYFDLPFTPSLFASGADHRTLPLFLAGTDRSVIRTEIQLPPGFKQVVIEPKTETLKPPGGGGIAHISGKNSGDKCVFTHDIEASSALVQPKDYPAMLKVQAELAKKSSRVFLLEKQSVVISP